MRVLITGSRGFIGTNLRLFLRERGDIEVVGFNADGTEEELKEKLKKADFIVHLAGVNRPNDTKEFISGNTDLTKRIVDLLNNYKKNIPLLFTSSIQAELNNDYGKSKKAAEDYILDNYNNGIVYRLHNVFGKYCRPNYNSVVATFCNNIAHRKEIYIEDPATKIRLIYIDDICKTFIGVMDGNIKTKKPYNYVGPVKETTLGELAEKLYTFRDCMESIDIPQTGDDFTKKLFSTYISYCDLNDMVFDNELHVDERGRFAELIHTVDSGQFSFSISHPGVKRGNHYHHTKVERFVVVKGKAKISLRKVGEKEIYEFVVSDKQIQSVTIPVGYTHSIENIGEDDMILMIWCNEIFDENNSDTFYEEV